MRLAGRCALGGLLAAGCHRELALPTATGDLPDLGLHSDAFADGQPIPELHTCDGEDTSPPLSWDDPPEGTATFALTVTDPDAPGGTAVHWTLWDLDGASTALPAALPADAPSQGPTYTGEPGWHGPCPPKGDDPHHYVFRLWAVDGALGLDVSSSIETLYRALDGRVLAMGEQIGTYGRE